MVALTSSMSHWSEEYRQTGQRGSELAHSEDRVRRMQFMSCLVARVEAPGKLERRLGGVAGALYHLRHSLKERSNWSGRVSTAVRAPACMQPHLHRRTHDIVCATCDARVRQGHSMPCGRGGLYVANINRSVRWSSARCFQYLLPLSGERAATKARTRSMALGPMLGSPT